MSSNIRVPRICQHCGKEFIAKTTVTQYCGDSCAKRAYKKRITDVKVKAMVSAASLKKRFLQQQLVDKEFLSISETCKLLGASRMTLYRLIKNSTINTAKIGRRTIIKRTDIDKLFHA